MEKIRVRFAPSPTGALHIGGIRTALYNYLLAKKHGGTFILRIEDTDQLRYVPGAEEYILESLRWCGLIPDEGPGFGGAFAPYRQSERKDTYSKYALLLVEMGQAYYAFDTPEEIEAMREQMKEKGNHTAQYDASTRMQMKNSLSLSAEAVKKLLDDGAPYTIRLKVPANESVQINDLIRGEVTFQTAELDDKVMLKSDGMPTYHLANVVDDHLMEITHVIRGEEWLPSAAHHVLIYRAFGWEDSMPRFAHLPLILKPNGNGKLSKRDGVRLGIPVFPLSWVGETKEDSFNGFRETGFDPRAVLNFLALLGWNPGTEQEIFSIEELTAAFSLERINKSGARFDYDKAKWFNQQYIIATDNATLAATVRPIIEAHGCHPDENYLQKFCGIMKERVTFYADFWTQGYYFFEDIRHFDEETIQKKWKPENRIHFEALSRLIEQEEMYESRQLETQVKGFISEKGLKMGDVMPMLRIALSGTMQGPAVFDMAVLFGKEETLRRLKRAYDHFDSVAGY